MRTPREYPYHHRFLLLISKPVLRLLIKTLITANIMTFSFIICGIFGSALLLSPNKLIQAAGLGLLLMYVLLDLVDGPIARHHNHTSVFGTYFELHRHIIVQSIVFAGISFAVYLNYFSHPIVFLFGFISTLGSVVYFTTYPILTHAFVIEGNNQVAIPRLYNEDQPNIGIRLAKSFYILVTDYELSITIYLPLGVFFDKLDWLLFFHGVIAIFNIPSSPPNKN